MKNKIIILLIILIIIFIGAFFFLTATHIEGIVYDSVTNKGISDAVVKINGITYKTDIDGKFRAYTPPLNKSINVEKSGYKNFSEVFPSKIGLQIVEIGLKPYSFEEIINNYKEKSETLKSYHYIYNIESSVDGSVENFSMESKWKQDAIYFKSVKKGEGASFLEIYIFNDYIYFRDSETKNFEKIEKSKFSEIPPTLSLSDIVDLFSIKSTPSKFVFVKEDKIDEDEVLLFDVSWEDLFSETKGTLYIRKKDNLIVKFNIEDTGSNEEGKSVKTKIDFTLLDINKEFTINPPQ
jgi:flagellar basal body-associated protein FliL